MFFAFIFALSICGQFALQPCDCKSWNGGITIQVFNSFNQDCYFLENILQKYYVSIDYQVIRSIGEVGGASSGNAIEFQLFPPNDIKELTKILPRSYGHFNFRADTDGDYKICFRDPSSIASGKIVFVSISIEDPEDKEANELDRLSRAIASAKLQGEEERARRFEQDLERLMKQNYEGIVHTMSLIHNDVWNMRRQQNLLSAAERRDFSHVEATGYRVTFWSSIYLILLIFCGFTQVAVVKSLFEEKNIFYKFFTPSKKI